MTQTSCHLEKIRFNPLGWLLKKLFVAMTVCLAISALYACSGGKAEKPVPLSISSPEELLNQGIYQYNNDNYLKATQTFDKALLQYRSIDNQAGIAKSCLNIAKSHMAVNNNNLAKNYLDKAEEVISKSSLDELRAHLLLLKSSLAINQADYDLALQGLEPVLSSNNTQIQLAALKNRTRIAFLLNDSDKLQWLEKYTVLQNSSPENTSSHAARILRFEAETVKDTDKKSALLSRSLSISQNLAARTAIAATLTQWADLDVAEKRYSDAEDKYLRALFIRHQLGDIKNSLAILKQLAVIFTETGNEKAAVANNWISRLESSDLSRWDDLTNDLDNFPKR